MQHKLARPGVEIVNLGLVDNPDRARAAGREFRRQDVDLLFLHVTTYALSSTVLPVVRRAKVPVIILNLAPEPAIDYAAFNRLGDRTKMTGEWLAHCCGLSGAGNRQRFPARRRAVPSDHRRAGRRPGLLARGRRLGRGRTGRRRHGGEPPRAHGALLRRHARHLLRRDAAVRDLRHARGDSWRWTSCPRSGAGWLRRRCGRAWRSSGDVFDVQPDCAAADLAEAARTSVALDRLVADHRLGSLAYFYSGTGVAENEATLASIILGTSLLTGSGVPVAGEYEVKNVQAMKIMDLFGAGGSFTEYYAMDFKDDVVLMGHDGPGHIKHRRGPDQGAPAPGLSRQGGARRVGRDGGEARAGDAALDHRNRRRPARPAVRRGANRWPGPIMEIGNTNSRYRFPCGAREFVNRWNAYGPAHHCAVGVGHIADKIEKLGQLLGLEVARVC